jgi:hypothetical protein
MSKIIKFVAKNEYFWEVAPKPFPASQSLPEWWRKETPYTITPDNPEGKKIIVENKTANATFKKCTPMLDALTSGYLIPTWADVQIRQDNGFPRITWKVEYNVFELHGESSTRVEPPTGYANIVFKFINPWIPKTPDGYSILITSPFGHKNLPFHAIPAVIDADKSTLEIVAPMWIKEGYEGILEKGTPLLQLTPFKRESWNSEFDFLKDGQYERILDKNFNGTILSHYIKNHWSKKNYK